MNCRCLLLLCLLPGVTENAFSQMGSFGYPLDVPADPRSVAMGESFVAVPSDPAALMYNPAGLTGLKGMSVSYSSRSQEWVPATEGWRIYSVNAVVATSFGVFGAQYNRKLMGTYPVTTMQFPDGNGSEMTLYSHDAALGYALKFPSGPAIGVSAKYYDFVQSVSGPSYGGGPALTATPAWLFDFGIMYTFAPLHAQTVVEDSITVGLSYQNIGSMWKVEYAYGPGLIVSAPSVQYIQLPQYFRIGFSYALKVLPGERAGLAPFAAVVSGEFRSLQSPVSGPAAASPVLYSTTYGVSQNPETSYWGLGLECTLFEILSLRGGASWKPYTDFEGERDRAAFRYGAAVHLPVRKIGIDLPLVFSVQYAVIPLNQLDYYSQTGSEKSSVPAFSFDVQYTGSPW